MKELIKYLLALTCLACLAFPQESYGQTNHDDYLNSDTDKKEFSDKQWKELKGKLKSESSGKSSSGDGFDGSDYSSGENSEGDYYDYYEEEYKGEFSEYQNYEDAENGDYDYSEYDDYESYSNDNYYYDDSDNSETFDYYEKPQDKSNKPKSKPSKSSNSPKVSSGGVSFMTMLLLFIGVALLAFLIYYFFMRYQEDKDGAAVTTNFDDVAPSEIPKSELERRLEDALGRGDFREAVRIYFIFIIKDLSDKNWIKWEKKKTNISYLIEMRSRPQYDLFNKSVSVFEVVWYGNYDIDRKSFQQVEPTFKKLLDAIHK